MGNPKRDQIIGQKIGQFLVLKFLYVKSHRNHYLCKCDCGNETTIHFTNLKNGLGRCGKCDTQRIDITGNKYGLITVIKFLRSDKQRDSVYRCECDCGEIFECTSGSLKKGNAKSCGCDRTKLNSLYDEMAKSKIGEKYGRLTIINVGRKGTKNKEGTFLCSCECGNRSEVTIGNLRSGGTKSCGCYAKEVASVLCVGQDNLRYNTNCYYTKNSENIFMRSYYELMFADILDNREVDWKYEPKIFKLKDGMRYKPDFCVGDQYYEVKGLWKDSSKEKVKEFIRQGYKLQIVYIEEIEKELGVGYRQYVKKHKIEHNIPIKKKSRRAIQLI